VPVGGEGSALGGVGGVRMLWVGLADSCIHGVGMWLVGCGWVG
jgi:hypothetical protein